MVTLEWRVVIHTMLATTWFITGGCFEHYSCPVEGERYTIILYSRLGVGNLPTEMLNKMLAWGCPVSDEQLQSSKRQSERLLAVPPSLSRPSGDVRYDDTAGVWSPDLIDGSDTDSEFDVSDGDDSGWGFIHELYDNNTALPSEHSRALRLPHKAPADVHGLLDPPLEVLRYVMKPDPDFPGLADHGNSAALKKGGT